LTFSNAEATTYKGAVFPLEVLLLSIATKVDACRAAEGGVFKEKRNR
jgi:hypothetical protein